jgi:hypothetical protein
MKYGIMATVFEASGIIGRRQGRCAKLQISAISERVALHLVLIHVLLEPSMSFAVVGGFCLDFEFHKGSINLTSLSLVPS